MKDKYGWEFSERTFQRNLKELVLEQKKEQIDTSATVTSIAPSQQVETSPTRSSTSSTISSSGNNRSLEDHKRKVKMARSDDKPRKFVPAPPLDMSLINVPAKRD